MKVVCIKIVNDKHYFQLGSKQLIREDQKTFIKQTDKLSRFKHKTKIINLNNSIQFSERILASRKTPN